VAAINGRPEPAAPAAEVVQVIRRASS
jgi:hypothetical protein